MRFAALSLSVAAALASGSALATAAAPRGEPLMLAPVLVDRIVAVVGGHPILLSELRHRIESRSSLRVPSLREHKQLRKAYRAALEAAINRRLTEIAARRAHIQIEPSAVDDALQRIALDAGMSVEQLLAYAEREGVDTATYRKEIEAQLLEWRALHAYVIEQGASAPTGQDMEAARKRWLAKLRRETFVERRWRP